MKVVGLIPATYYSVAILFFENSVNREVASGQLHLAEPGQPLFRNR